MPDSHEPSVPPGWYADPERHGLERWWSGKGWTEHTRQRQEQFSHAAATPPAPTRPSDSPVEPSRTATSGRVVNDRRRFGAGEVVALIVLLVLLAASVPTGIGGVLIMLALVTVIVSTWALIRGRNRVFRIQSRTAATATLAVSIVMLFIGSGVYAATNPTATRSDAPAVVAPKPAATPAVAEKTRATPPSATPHPAADSAVAILASLAIKGKSPLTGYRRVHDFGPAWADVDGNGCDTRDDVLKRDLTKITLRGCEVETGALTDPYTRKIINFSRGETTGAAVQIDHVVSLADAWQTGAQALTYTRRMDLANDPINLFAVDGPTNETKGDGDTATWLPTNKSFRCTYVAHQVAVKAAYHLWVTQAEHDAMARVLASCPSATAPTSLTSNLTPSIPASAPTVTPTAMKKPTTKSAVYYANCAAVRAAGKAPLHRGQPGYRSALDRDGDGVACEETSRSSKGSSGSSSSSHSGSGAPAGATARCNDGSYSWSQHHSGTCSHHGGVATWL